MPQSIVEQLGLEESEAKVYLALLELGPSTVTEVTKKAGITRTLGYHVLEKLGLDGLVNRVSGGKKQQYVAEHPRTLVQHLKNIEGSWQRKIKTVEESLPDLLSLYKMSEKPVMRYQQGVGAVKRMYEEALTAKTDILSILDVESWQAPEFWEWAKGYNRERNRAKVKERILLLDTKAAREWIKNYRGSQKYTVYRWVRGDEVHALKGFGGEMHLYNNNLMFSLLKKPHIMGVTIESSILVTIVKTLFELAWAKAEVVYK